VDKLVSVVEATVVRYVDAKAVEIVQRRQLHLVVLTNHLGVRQVITSLRSMSTHNRYMPAPQLNKASYYKLIMHQHFNHQS